MRKWETGESLSIFSLIVIYGDPFPSVPLERITFGHEYNQTQNNLGTSGLWADSPCGRKWE